MKVIMKPIEMIAWFTNEGNPVPLRYRIESEDKTNVVIKVDRVITSEEEKLAGNKMIVYKCESIINNIQKIYEIKYEIDSCKWFLFKM
ncbi:hypothetical protein [Anaerosalibacter sp. Marseille-P3206]|uniref:hypothetical protein n=1 Tax=Anaerosalibacter sp. Marseille-P3206 TaxID=1871005 RepID=UPI000984C27A|nr:hypothetical protein [Anaerosalibacter sp. Marseille-P3206]